MAKEKGLYLRGGTWGISYYHNGKHIRKAIGTKGEARKELTAIRAMIDRRTYVPPREDSFGKPERVKRPPKGNGRTQYLKVEEVGRLLDECPPHLYSNVLCSVETGMRPAEVKGLRWSEIKKVTLQDGSTARMIYLPPERTKTRHARKVPVSARLSAHLDAIEEGQKSPKVIPFSDLVLRFPKVRRARKRDNRKPHLVSGPLKDIRLSWAAALEKANLAPDSSTRFAEDVSYSHEDGRGGQFHAE
jgi:integrase